MNFRIRDKKTNQIIDNIALFPNGSMFMYINDKLKKVNNDNYIIELSTYLLDINNNEIYEGDEVIYIGEDSSTVIEKLEPTLIKIDVKVI